MPESAVLPAEIERAVPHPGMSQQSSFEAMVAEKTAEAEAAAGNVEDEAAPSAEKEKKATAKKQSAEELEEATRLMAERLGFRSKPKKDVEKADKEKADAAKAKADEESAAAAEKKVTVRRRTPADSEEVATLAANTAAKTVAQALEHLKPAKPVKADPLAEVEASLTEEEKDKLIVFRRMAEGDPAKKDLPAQFLHEVRKVADYQAEWEKENPGQPFNIEDAAHDAFYEKVAAKYSPKEFKQAEIDMAVDRRLTADQSKREKERADDKAETAIKELEPVIRQTTLTAAKEILTALNPDHDKLVTEKGWDAFVESDPIAADVLQHAAARVAPFIEAARQIDEPKSRIAISDKNPAHVEYVNYLIAQEEAVTNGPAKDRIRDGKRFATRRELAKIPQAQRRNFWFLDDGELIARRVGEEAQLAKTAYENELARVDKLAEKRGYKRVNGASTVQTSTRQTATTPAKTNGETRSPESLGSATNAASGTPEANSISSAFDLASKILFRQ